MITVINMILLIVVEVDTTRERKTKTANVVSHRGAKNNLANMMMTLMTMSLVMVMVMMMTLITMTLVMVMVMTMTLIAMTLVMVMVMTLMTLVMVMVMMMTLKTPDQAAL